MKYITLIVLAIVIAVQSRAQSYQWVRGGGSTDFPSSGVQTESVYDMATDVNGNVYALSYMNYIGPITADTFYSLGGYGAVNYFLSSYTCDGQMRWAKLIGSTGGECIPFGLALDNVGHIYVAGIAYSDVLHIGYDTSVTGYTYQLQALMQFDTSGGYHWMRYVGDNTYATLTGTIAGDCSLDVDSSNNVHFFCSVKYGVHLTPAITSHRGTYDLKYDGSGNLLDVKRLQLDSLRQISKVTLDKKSNKAYAIGYNATLPVGVYERPFLAAFDVNRNNIWEDTLTSPAMPGGCGCGFAQVKTDEAGNLYAAGVGYGTIVYNGDTASNDLLSGSYGISFIMRLDTNNSPKWIRTYSGTTVNSMQSLSLVSGNKIAVVGLVGGKIRSGYDSIISYAGEGQNPFFTIVDTAGSVFTLQQLHGNGFYDWGTAVTGDQKGSIYIGGRVENQLWTGTLSPYTSHGGTSDFFVMKYGANCDCTSNPVASFTAVGTHTVNFTYTGTPGSTPLDSVCWYFGDGGTSTVLNPVHVYTTGGTYSACVRVYSSCGGDVECMNVVIPCPYAPLASFTQTGVYNKSFTYTGTTAGVDSMRWKFGDGGTSTLTNPTHTYTMPGTYTACVSIYTWCGWDSSCVTFTVPCVTAPVTSYTYTGTGDTRGFTYTGTTTAMDSIRWNFGDGATSTAVSPSHTYATPGTYAVCVTFYNPCGSSTICHTVSVPCLGTPTASFDLTGTLATRNFLYTGSSAGVDSVGWNFGDGWRMDGLSAAHTYTSIGTFHVCAVAFSQCGNDTVCEDLFVPCLSAPAASFTHTVSHDSTGHFTYSAPTAGVDSVKWQFGTGDTAMGTTVSHHYTAIGTYTVCVVAYSQCGNDTLCDTIKIISCLSTPGMALRDIVIRPNPLHHVLMIDNASGCTALLSDITGRLMRREYISSASGTVDCSGLLSGVYVLKVVADDGEVRVFRVVRE